MTDFKLATWMSGWTEQDHKEYAAAWEAATSVSDHTGARAREWLRLVLDAQQAHRTWAAGVLADMQERGALESWKQAPVVPVVKNKRGKTLTTRAAAKRRSDDGETTAFVQDSLFNMTDEELQEVEALGWSMSATHRDKALLARRLRELIVEAGGGCTAQEAANRMGVNLTDWCAA